MSDSPMIESIIRLLHEAGYRELATPFRVATVEFEFTAALRGSDRRALDLVLLVDTTTGNFGDRDSARVNQRVGALGRALDVTGSRYVVTVILAGAVLGDEIEMLAETCRVLHVDRVQLGTDGMLTEEARKRLEDQIRVLLPLALPPPLASGEEENGSVMDQLVRALPSRADKELEAAILEASKLGEQAVTNAMVSALSAVLLIDEQS
tara:strand:- start:15465 stop:16088 length:624 start_codon:yes stop_codon:yes gene_type:complete